MTKYRKKPVVVEAMEFKDDTVQLIKLAEFLQEPCNVDYKDPDKPVLKIATLEGTMAASIGDFIIKGVNGEFYPCKPDIFWKTYEKAENIDNS